MKIIEANPTVEGFKDMLICPYSTGFTITNTGGITGVDIFYFLIGAGILAAIYQRTQSVEFTATIAMVCGFALITLFPISMIKPALGLIGLAIAGVLIKIFKDRG